MLYICLIFYYDWCSHTVLIMNLFAFFIYLLCVLYFYDDERCKMNFLVRDNKVLLYYIVLYSTYWILTCDLIIAWIRDRNIFKLSLLTLTFDLMNDIIMFKIHVGPPEWYFLVMSNSIKRRWQNPSTTYYIS